MEIYFFFSNKISKMITPIKVDDCLNFSSKEKYLKDVSSKMVEDFKYSMEMKANGEMEECVPLIIEYPMR